MRGRKNKPTALRLVEGNAGKRPINAKEPMPEGAMPTMPAHITGPARTEWRRMAGELFELGLLTGLDRAAFAGYCESYGRWVQATNSLKAMAAKDKLTHGLLIKTTNGNLIQNPIVGVARSALSDAIRYSAEFGGTPSARARLEVGGGEGKKSETDKFF